VFSSLSESGFIPTFVMEPSSRGRPWKVLISFREWLHSYNMVPGSRRLLGGEVLISFREWLHSYLRKFLMVLNVQTRSSHLFQRVASFLPDEKEGNAMEKASIVLISFREWLHSYPDGAATIREQFRNSSHLFQRVASFLLATITITTTTM